MFFTCISIFVSHDISRLAEDLTCARIFCFGKELSIYIILININLSCLTFTGVGGGGVDGGWGGT